MKYIKTKPHLVIIGFFVIVKIFILIFLIKDRGWEPDSYMHLLQIRTVFQDFPSHITLGLGVWEKPVYIYPIAFVYQIFGLEKLIWAQIINVFYFSLISYFLYKSIFIITKNKVLSLTGLVLVNISILSLTSSLTALTEPVFTLCLISSFYFLLKKNYYLSALLIGLSITARIEGFLFVGLFVLFIAFEQFIEQKISKKTIIEFFKIGIISAIPVLLWITLGGIHFNNFLFLVDRGYPTNEGIYGFGNLYDFPKRLLIQETFIFLGSILSTYFIFRKFDKSKKYLALAWGYFFVFLSSQIILWQLGQLGSAGLMRYLVSIMPFGIICFCYFLYSIRDSEFIKLDHRFLYFGIILGTFAITVGNYVGVGPFSPKWIHFEEELRMAGEWYKENSTKPLHTIRPSVVYYSGIKENSYKSVENYSNELFSNEQGIYIWSESWADVAGLRIEDLESHAQLREKYGDDVYVFEI